MQRIDARNRMVSPGAATFVIGLLFVAVGVESLAAFNACVADPACLPYVGALNVGAFFAILAVGIVLALIGARILEAWLKVSRKAFP